MSRVYNFQTGRKKKKKRNGVRRAQIVQMIRKEKNKRLRKI